jgi:hypothetical protein
MTYNPGDLAVFGSEFCQAMNVTASIVTAGTGVLYTSCTLPSPIAGQGPGTAHSAFDFVTPSGAVTSHSLGVVMDDVLSGDIGLIMTAGVIAARSDMTAGATQPLTLDLLGRMTLATSGREVLAFALAAPSSNAIWCRLVPPFIL